ncbi:MAG: hypothetical protein HY438_01685 [DPANN group archaeon]|nr:hypothetical protein [DPANN group archaeon]
MDILNTENYLRRLGAEMRGTYSENEPFTVFKIGGTPIVFYLYNNWLEIGITGQNFYKGKIFLPALEDEIALDVEVLSWTAERKFEQPEGKKLFERLEDFVLGKHGIKVTQTTPSQPVNLILTR